MTSDLDRERAKEHGFDRFRRIDLAFQRGEITQGQWHDEVRAVVEPVYLDAETEQMGSGHAGTAEEWRASRGMVLHAVDRPGSFLDVGCANGLLMASVATWSGERGLSIEPYGVEISPPIAALARARYPQWHDRIWTANAAHWQPPMRFDYVRTGLEYVPSTRREAYVRHLLDHVVTPGGRLVVGKNNEDRGRSAIADDLRAWGFSAVTEVRGPHAHPDVEMSVVWFDNR
ncbi:trans-aconitate 2-methyltransferase [Nocardioides sp. MH1]|uniref:class I SAM-dependent methyltransferase n=1 Tax=Nocardioides sp. MH1 TaxID=3242490 RepID=UPI0035226875